MATIYEKNLEALSTSHPLLFARLYKFAANERFSVYQGKDPLQINLYDTQTQTAFYDQPIHDTLNKIDAFQNYEKFPYLYSYGLGNGVFFKALCAQPTRRRIVVIEPQLEILFITLNLIDFSHELVDGRLVLMLSEDLFFASAVELFHLFDTKVFAKTFFLDVTLTYYETTYNDDILRVSKLLTDTLEYCIIGHGNDAHDSLIGLDHHIRNLPQMVKSEPLETLKDLKKGETAIIISTGPSLAKQIPLLKQVAPYATLICIDASMPILEQNGIKPDIVVSIERVEATANFYKRTSPTFREGILFVVASLSHPSLLEAIHGERVILATRPFNYTRFFELHQFGYIGLGMSAANMAHDLAYFMGHTQCVLIGQDLAFGNDGTSHSQGHIFGSTEVNAKDSDLYVTRYGGEGIIRTSYVWNLFRGFFETGIAGTEGEMTTVNATEGGARITGALEKPFADVCHQLMENHPPKTPIAPLPCLESELLLGNVKKTLTQIIETGKKFERRVMSIYHDLNTYCNTIVELNTQNRLEEIDYNKLHRLNVRIDKIKELFNDPMLKNLYFDILQSYILHQEIDLALITVQSITSTQEQQAQLVEWLMRHRYWLLSLAGGVKVIRQTIQKASQTKEWKS